jgi:hypothetical protein
MKKETISRSVKLARCSNKLKIKDKRLIKICNKRIVWEFREGKKWPGDEAGK